MTHQQSYKPAETVSQALDELRLKAGTQFDPDLVQAFVRMMDG